MVQAIETAVRFYEAPPTTGMTVETEWSEIWLGPDDWTEAFEAQPGVPHNEARDQIWQELIAILVDKHDDDDSAELLRESLLQNNELRSALNGAWPLLEAADLVGDLWSVPAYLRKCAPWLSPADVQKLQRETPRPGRCPTCRSWTQHGSGSAIRRRHDVNVAMTLQSPPSASRWPWSSTT